MVTKLKILNKDKYIGDNEGIIGDINESIYKNEDFL